MSDQKQKVSVGAEQIASAFAGMPSGAKITTGDKLPGVPGGLLVPTADAPEFPPHMEFNLDPKKVSPTFSMGPEMLVFGLKELDPAEERLALENGGKNPMSVQAEMVKAALVRIGDKAPTYKEKEAWLKAIGPKARRGVDYVFQHINFMSDDEGESLLATGTPVR